MCHCLLLETSAGPVLVETGMGTRARARPDNHRRLRELVREHPSQVTVFSSHDITEFERLAGEP